MGLELGRIAQVAMSVSDVDRSVEFYEGRLGLKLALRPHPSMAFFDCDGLMLYLNQAQHEDATPAASVLYFACEDVAVATRELEAMGVEVVSQPHCISQQPGHDLWMSFFKDPDGHLLALHMQAPRGWKPD